MIPALRQLVLNLALIALSILLATLLLALGLTLAGYPAATVLHDWLLGAIGTRGDWLVAVKNACPLILTGLAAGIAFRSGVFNIGAEGQSIAGAALATAVATRLFPSLPTPWLAIPAALLTAALAGALWALIAAAMDRYRAVPIVLSTILLNFIALQLLGVLLEGPLKAAGTEIVQSDILPASFHLPIFLSAPGGYLHIGLLIAAALALASWLVQSRTTFGFELLVTGLNPTAARLAGMPVAARQFSVMLLSGAFAGIAGAIQVMGVEGYSLGPRPVSYGYAGIAVALLGRLHPLGILLAALFFALLDRGADNLEFSGLNLPREAADIVKGTIVLLLLLATTFLASRQTTARER